MKPYVDLLKLKAFFLDRGRWAQFIFLFMFVLLPLLVFGMLAEDIVEKELLSFDRPLMEFVHRHANATLDTSMIWMTRLGSAYVLLPFNLCIFVYLYLRRDKLQASFWLFSVGGAALLNFFAKQGFARVRPAFWISIRPEVTYSFPSGHAMHTAAVVVALIVLSWQTRGRWAVMVTGIFFVFLVGLSRIYLGVHFPSDVLAGWMASLVWVVGLARLFRLI